MVCTVIFMSNPNTVLRLCCVVVEVVTIEFHVSAELSLDTSEFDNTPP